MNKIPNFRQILKLPQVLSGIKKRLLVALFIIFIASSALWLWRFYENHLSVFPTSGGEYTEGLVGSPVYINPLLQTTDVERDLTSLIFSGLMKRDKNQQLVNDLAESYEVSKDFKSYTFKLRRDVFWHDGERLNADDVVFTIESVKNPDYKSPFLISFSGATIEKIDDYTVKFNLSEPYAPFLNILTLGIISEHIWSKIEPSNASLAPYNLAPIGSGEWKFVKSIKDEVGSFKSIELEKFDKYYGVKPYLDKLVFKFYPDSTEAIDGLKNKNAQSLGFVSKDDKNKINKFKYVNLISLNLPQYFALFFNQKNNDALQDINIRQALALSIDKNRIIMEAINSEGVAIDSPILAGQIGYNPDLEKYGFDIDKSNKILDDNKWLIVSAEELIKQREEYYIKKIKDLEKQIETAKKAAETSAQSSPANSSATVDNLTANNVGGLESEKTQLTESLANLDQLKKQSFFRQKDGKTLKIKLTTLDKAENITTVNLVKEMWSKIGIEVEIEIVDKIRIQKDVIKPRNYEVLLFGEAVGFDPDPYPFWHSSQNQDPGLNLAVFSNKDVDQLLEEARKEADEKIRAEKYISFQNILAKEIPAIFLYSPTYTYPLSEKIKGFDISRISLPSDRFNNIEEWYVNTENDFKWK